MIQRQEQEPILPTTTTSRKNDSNTRPFQGRRHDHHHQQLIQHAPTTPHFPKSQSCTHRSSWDLSSSSSLSSSTSSDIVPFLMFRFFLGENSKKNNHSNQMWTPEKMAATRERLLTAARQREWDDLVGMLLLFPREELLSVKDETGTNGAGSTLLHYAAFHGAPLRVWDLLFHLYPVSAWQARDYGGHDTPLHVASYAGHRHIVEAFLSKMKAVTVPEQKARRKRSQKLLSPASVPSYDAFASFVDARNSHGYTPLHFASSYPDHLPVVQTLVQVGKASVHARTNDGETPLHLAVRWQCFHTIAWLGTVGQADVNAPRGDAQKNTPLHEAILHEQEQNDDLKYDNLRMVQFLVSEVGASLWATNAAGETPLHTAARLGKVDIVQWILQSSFINECMPPNKIDLINDLVNEPDCNGNTPLHLACREGHIDVVKALLTLGKAHVNARNSWEETPLHMTAIHGDLDLIYWLLREGGGVTQILAALPC